MSNFNTPSNFNTSFTPKAPARKMSPVLVGGIVLALIAGIGSLGGNSHGHQTNQPPMTSQYNDDRSSENGDTGQNEEAGADQGYRENGYSPQGSYSPAPTDQSPNDPAPSTGGDATDNGYAERERVQDQAAQANDGYIRGTDTVRDTENGQVYTDVPNDQADAAVQSGAATEVPTAELPTSGDSGTASPPDAPAAE